MKGWRPPKTTRQAGSAEVDWSRTYHVETPAAFVNGLFGLYSSVFEDFLKDAGNAADLGDTVLYQVSEPVHLRFEIKKIGPNEFEIRGAHFSTPGGCNICLGMNPLDVSSSGAGQMYFNNPFTTTGWPTTTTGTPTTTTGWPTTTTGTPFTTTGWPTTTTGTPTTTTGWPTTTTGTPTTTTGWPTTTTGTPTTTTGWPTTTTGTPTTTTGWPTTTTGTPFTTTGWPTTTTGTPTTTTGWPTTTTGTPTTTTGWPTTTTGTPTTTTGWPTTTGTPTTTTGWPTTTTGTPTTTTGWPTTTTGGTTSTARAGLEEFLAAGGQEVLNLASDLRAEGKHALPDEERFVEVREKLNKLAGLLDSYRL